MEGHISRRKVRAKIAHAYRANHITCTFRLDKTIAVLWPLNNGVMNFSWEWIRGEVHHVFDKAKSLPRNQRVNKIRSATTVGRD